MSDDLTKIPERLKSVDDPVGFLTSLFEHAPVAFAIWKPNGQPLLANQALRDLFGSIPPPEYNIFEDDLVAERGLADLIKQAFVGETIHLPTFWYDPRDLKSVTVEEGRRVAISMTIFPVHDQHGNITYVAATYKDETEVKLTIELLQAESERLKEQINIAQQQTSQRQYAELALLESEQRFRLMAEGAREYSLILLDSKGYIVNWNSGAEYLEGYHAQEIVGQSFTCFYTPEDIERGWPHQLLKMAEENGSVEDEGWRVHKDGLRYWANVVITALKDKDGQLSGFSKLTRDTTERKATEERLKQSEAQLVASQRIAHLGGWEIDLVDGQYHDSNPVRWSDEVYRILGFTPGEFEASNERFFQVVHPDDRGMILEVLGRALYTGMPQSFDCRIICPDGSERVVHEQGEVIFEDGMDHPIRLIGTIQDITEQRRIEDALRMQEEKSRNYQEKLKTLHRVNIVLSKTEPLDELYRRAIELGQEWLAFDRIGLFLIGADPDIATGTYGTNTEGRLRSEYGLAFNWRQSTSDWETHSSFSNVLVKRDAQLSEQGQVLGRGWNMLAMLGSEDHPIGLVAADNLVHHKPLREEDLELLNLYAAVLGALILRKQAQEELLHLNEQLEDRVMERTKDLQAANRELETFSYSVSHDLRAPLRSIDGFSQILLEDYTDRLDEHGQDYLRRIRTASQRMGALIDDLLKLANVTRAEMNYMDVNLTNIVHSVIDELRAVQPGREVEFVIQQELVVHADANLMRILIQNLIDNAWKYTSKHPQARIEFGMTRNAGERTYFVRDDGAGFDMAYANKLFGPFQRLHKGEDFAGTGIGLATVQRIAARHGGRAWAEAAIEQGATFYFTVPVPSSTT